MTPIDPDAYYGPPDLFTPQYDEVHISVVFTWDKPKAERLALEWRRYGSVRIGGPAIDGESAEPMIPGRYLRPGITITSRGCIKACSFCMVRRGLVELDSFPDGNIVQDNNLLACGWGHRARVWDMLKKQKSIEFRGGIDKYLMTDKIAADMRLLSVKEIWMACDSNKDIEPLRIAISKLNKVGFTREHLYCYVLIGKDIADDEARLRAVYAAGVLPFAQLYIDRDNSIKYSREYRRFARIWSRPALYRRLCK
jgi:hypothetical protein